MIKATPYTGVVFYICFFIYGIKKGSRAMSRDPFYLI